MTGESGNPADSGSSCVDIYISGKENRRTLKLERKKREFEISKKLFYQIFTEIKRAQCTDDAEQDLDWDVESQDEEIQYEDDDAFPYAEFHFQERRRRSKWKDSKRDYLKEFSKKQGNIEKLSEMTCGYSKRGKPVKISHERRELKRNLQVYEHYTKRKANIEKNLQKKNLKRPGPRTKTDKAVTFDQYILKPQDGNAKKITKEKGQQFTQYLVDLQHREIELADLQQLAQLDSKEKSGKEMMLFEQELENFLMALQYRDITPEDYEQLTRLDESVAPKTAPKNIINKLETVSFDPLTHNTLELCNICMDEFTQEQLIIQLKCKHYFHSDCITNWLENCSTKCPLDGSEAC